MNRLPTRWILTQYGAVKPLLVTVDVDPPEEVRVEKMIPLPGVTAILASLDPSVRLSRIITPALAALFEFETVRTLATIVQSPLAVW